MQTRSASLKILQDAAKVTLLFTVLVFSLLARTQDRTADARSFTDSVLAMFDQGKYSDIYDLFDSTTHQMTREQWVQACQAVAQQRGKAIGRELSDATKSMGVYRFVFAAKCTDGKTFEDLSVTNKNGDWKLLRFWVKPNLESDKSQSDKSR
ncbi:MAG: hypothetical protein LAO20_07415 [Acidobacteriia bacterium]|nr:hypothetical protein [Terriglobia bacterium]